MIGSLKTAMAFAVLFAFAGSPAIASADSPSVRAEVWLEAMLLPEAAHQLRAAGVPSVEVRIAITALRRSRGDESNERAARRSARILRAEVESVREHGPMENFGGFVRSQVESGLRGQELASAIREQRGQRGRSGQAATEKGAEERPAATSRPAAPRGPAATGRSGAGDRRPAAAPGRSGARDRRSTATPGRSGGTQGRQPAGGKAAPTRQDQQQSPGRTGRTPAGR